MKKSRIGAGTGSEPSFEFAGLDEEVDTQRGLGPATRIKSLLHAQVDDSVIPRK
jgi:hypothetical protein